MTVYLELGLNYCVRSINPTCPIKCTVPGPFPAGRPPKTIMTHQHTTLTGEQVV